MNEKRPRTPLRIACIAAGIALLASIVITGIVSIAFLPSNGDPEKLGEACGQAAFFVALVAGGIAYVIASRRRT
ncbi:MAG TPA: hypothetical protein VL463_28495 [Kofleriaceae bacterium]|nr:hypothetical protein [Kofleriaceae bacterium]